MPDPRPHDDRYWCNICGMSFNSEPELREHQETHITDGRVDAGTRGGSAGIGTIAGTDLTTGDEVNEDEAE